MSFISMGDVDLLHPPKELEQRRHKLKRLVQSPNSFFMDVKCPGCFNITTVHACLHMSCALGAGEKQHARARPFCASAHAAPPPTQLLAASISVHCCHADGRPLCPMPLPNSSAQHIPLLLSPSAAATATTAAAATRAITNALCPHYRPSPR